MSHAIRIAPIAVWAFGCLSPIVAAQQVPPQSEQVPVADEVLVIGRIESDGVPVVPLEYPASRDILDPEVVRSIGARDLNDLVLQIPTLATRPYNGGEASAPSFGARGLPDDGLTEYINISIDGVPANAGPYGWTAFSFMPLASERVHAVDSIRGGHTVRYSPNTVGGVLNFVTRPIPEALEFTARQSFGTQGFASSFLTGGTTTSNGTGYRFSLLDRHGNGYRADGGFTQQDFAAQVRQSYDDGSWLATSVSWFRDEHAAPGGLTAAEFAADRWANSRPENNFEGFRGLVDVVYHRPSGEDWWEAFAALSVTERNLYAKRSSGGSDVLDDWHDQTFFGNLGLRGERHFRFGDTEHVVHAGARAHREWLPSYAIQRANYGSTAFSTRTDSSFRMLALSAHVDDSFSPMDRLEVTAGARLEWIPSTSGNDAVSGFTYEDSFLDLLPAAGMSYRLSDRTALFANYGEGFRAPQFWGFAYTADPKDALSFESGKSAEVGFRFEDVSGFSGSVAGWQLDFDNYLVFDTGYYENVGAIDSKGIDLILDFDAARLSRSLRGLRLHGSVTLQDSTLETGANAGNDVPYAWDTKATWRGIYASESGCYLSIGGVHVGDSFSDEANTSTASADGRLGVNDAVTLWDAQLARDFLLGEHLIIQVAVGATNLFDREWEVHSRGGFFGPGLVAGAPRQAYASVLLEVL